MISLRALLEEFEPGEVWRVQRSGRFGAMNQSKVVRYFDDQKEARLFAAGEIAGPPSGRPEPKDVIQKIEPKQKYDVRPK